MGFFLGHSDLARTLAALPMCWMMGSLLWPDTFYGAEAIGCHTRASFVHEEGSCSFIFSLALCSVMLPSAVGKKASCPVRAITANKQSHSPAMHVAVLKGAGIASLR